MARAAIVTYSLFKTIDLSSAITALGWPGEYAGAITPVIVDLNADQQLDIALHVSQGQGSADWGSVTNEPTLNRLLLFVSQPDQSYREQTSDLLTTSSTAVLPGMSRKVAIADINLDGVVDWVYALNREDGRSGSPAENNIAQAAAVVSVEGGLYSVIHVGPANWYHHVAIDTQSFQTPMVVLSGYNSGPGFGGSADGYILGGGYGYLWSDRNDVFGSGNAVPAHANTAVTLRSTSVGPLYLSVINDLEGFQLLGLFARTGSTWRMVDDLSPYPSQTVNFVSYSLDRGTAELFELSSGVYGTAGGYSESRPIALYPGDTGTAVFKFSAAVVDAPRDDGFYYQDDGYAYQTLDFYRAQSDQLIALPVRVVNEDHALNGNFIDVLDFNRDGLEDVVVYPYVSGGQPRVYLNTGGDLFYGLDPHIFPEAPSQWGDAASSKFADVNGDGVWDLFYAPMNGFSTLLSDQMLWGIYLGSNTFDAALVVDDLHVLDRLGSTLIHTWSGNDRVTDIGASEQDTTIDLGAGIDRVEYAQPLSRYTVAGSNGQFVVAESGGTWSDILIAVERLLFPDAKLALDLDGHAGKVAKLLGAVFGADAVSNKEYVGIGLSYLDSGMTYADLGALAVYAAGKTSHADICTLLWTNVVGAAPTAADIAPYTTMLDSGQLSVGGLVALAADTSYNTENIDLIGLAQTGLEYV